jgi:hypothetical protein
MKQTTGAEDKRRARDAPLPKTAERVSAAAMPVATTGSMLAGISGLK